MTEERLKIIDKIHKDKFDDITYDKMIILKDLFKDADLLELLNNKELENINASPEDYYNVNIFSYLKIPETQSVVKNFICFEVDDTEEVYGNNVMISKLVRFRTVSHEDDIITEYGMNRQDLLALIIKDRFNWSNILGMQLKKIYDEGKVSENDYYYRDIWYKTITPNSLQKGTTTNYMVR